VLAMGVAWDGGQFYEKGLFRGKQAMMIIAAGHPAEYYSASGLHKTTLVQALHPINCNVLAFCGFDVHEPFAALNVLGVDKPGKEKLLEDLKFRLDHLVDSPTWLSKY
jgi:NAD(P)H dehydrogenase (quinone)